MDGDVEVLEILPGDRAIVSTKGLQRVIASESGQVVAELLPPRIAEAAARGWNAIPGDEAVVEPYST